MRSLFGIKLHSSQGSVSREKFHCMHVEEMNFFVKKVSILQKMLHFYIFV